MPTRLEICTGTVDGYGTDLPLDRELGTAIHLDLSALCRGGIHPMLGLRIRLFIDWHRLAGNAVTVAAPRHEPTALRLAQLGVAQGLPTEVLELPPCEPDPDVLPLRRFSTHHDVEDLAQAAVDLLQAQTAQFGEWGDSIHMAISELCDNAIQHGRNDLGAYIAADRIASPRRSFRLAIADLGMGIPAHIRKRHPEWYDDTAAITRALVRGVSGTDDPHRGNGFAEVMETPVLNDLIRAGSAADLDLRSGEGHVGVQIFGGNPLPQERAVDRPRHGTWITYTITTAA